MNPTWTLGRPLPSPPLSAHQIHLTFPPPSMILQSLPSKSSWLPSPATVVSWLHRRYLRITLSGSTSEPCSWVSCRAKDSSPAAPRWRCNWAAPAVVSGGPGTGGRGWARQGQWPLRVSSRWKKHRRRWSWVAPSWRSRGLGLELGPGGTPATGITSNGMVTSFRQFPFLLNAYQECALVGKLFIRVSWEAAVCFLHGNRSLV